MGRNLAAFSLSFTLVGLSACQPAQEDEAGGTAHDDGGDPASTTRSADLAPVIAAAGSAIIYFSREVDLPTLAAAGRAGRRALSEALHQDAARAQSQTLALMREHGVEPGARLWMINALAADLSDALIEEIAQLPEVERIGPDLRVERLESQLLIDPMPADSATAAPWNLAAIGAPELWATGQRGAGVVVATLDTGVDLEHPELAGSWRSTAGWYDPYGQHALPFDKHGHGTWVMGLLVGGDESGQPIGVAPEAEWISAKIFDDAGKASLSKIHLALQWTMDPDEDASTDDAPDIITGSWGYSDFVGRCYLEFEPDIAALRAAQIANVFAAGNSGPYAASSVSPANNPFAFAAGALDDDLMVATSSARGPSSCTGSIFPELVAPGANVKTTDLTLHGRFPSSYVFVSGTSFAAPHIAGAMALLRGAHPSATVSQLEHALTATAVRLSRAGPDNDSGFGLPDLIAAEKHLARLVTRPRCTDSDADGYFVEPACGSALDCNDDDDAIRPGSCDRARDGIDQDCDGSDPFKDAPCRR